MAFGFQSDGLWAEEPNKKTLRNSGNCTQKTTLPTFLRDLPRVYSESSYCNFFQVFDTMKKGKHKQTGALAKKKGKPQSSNVEGVEIEHDWVIVKKQKITILVPPTPLPVHKKRTRHAITKRSEKNSPSGESMDQRPRQLKSLGVAKAVRPIVFHRPVCLNVTALQNRMMRASNLERKLVKAGGLNRWLLSLDLGQFVKMFHIRNVDKFQLLSLTMEKLKDMGVNAVGPRRKLIHAIDCVNHPYCFTTS